MIDNNFSINDNNVSNTITTYKKKSFYTPQDIIEKESQNDILSGLLLTWAGCYTKAYGHKVINRVLDDYVIIYCVDGLGWLQLEDKYWIIKKGDFFVCPPKFAHSYGADEKNPWTKYWIHFRGNNATSYINMLGLSLSSPIIHIGENIKVISWIQDIFNILEMGYTQSNLFFATSHLANILCYINSLSMNMMLNKSEDINVKSIITYMLDNMHGNLSLDELSNYASMSKYHFSRLFKEKTGYTPIDYYIRLKVQKACELLESSTVKINNISSDLGFNNVYYFSTTFKRIIGLSPQNYRNNFQHV